MKKEIVISIIVILVLIVGAFLIFQSNNSEDTDNINQNSQEVVEEELPLNQRQVRTLSDGTKYIVDPDKIKRGIAGIADPKDKIPSIDNPKYVSVSEADEWIQDDELVLALQYKEVKRIYPLQILVWHEIVNDEAAGDPLLITYCPLCGSGIAYERKIVIDSLEEEVEFGTSGKLYNSNLVMYDRKTNTYWSQIDGVAILGKLTGQELKEISIDTVVWREWKLLHGDSEVLSQNTGHLRSYGEDPYGSYYEDSFVLFPVEKSDSRIHPKTVVFGVEVDNNFKAYRESDLIENSEIIDNFNGVNLKITRSQEGIVKIFRFDTNEEVVKERDFWFAWYAFHPDTELYGF